MRRFSDRGFRAEEQNTNNDEKQEQTAKSRFKGRLAARDSRTAESTAQLTVLDRRNQELENNLRNIISVSENALNQMTAEKQMLEAVMKQTKTERQALKATLRKLTTQSKREKQALRETLRETLREEKRLLEMVIKEQKATIKKLTEENEVWASLTKTLEAKCNRLEQEQH